MQAFFDAFVTQIRFIFSPIDYSLRHKKDLLQPLPKND